MPKRTPASTERRIVALRQQGLDGPDIVRRVGVDTTTVYSVLRRNGVAVCRDRYTAEQRARIAAVWRQTRSIVQVRDEFPGISKNTVRRIADAAGDVERIVAGGRMVPLDLERTICDRYQTDQTAVEIAGATGVSKSTVLNVLRRRGISARRTAEVASTHRSLGELHPELVAEWDHDRNGGLQPGQVPARSTKAVHWACPRGPDHRWKMRVRLRTQRGQGCPFCAGRRVSVTNCLATRAPELVEQWHPTSNGSRHPGGVVATATTRITWRCPKGSDHVWEARLVDRTRPDGKGTGCPCCENLAVSVTNSLATVAPQLVEQWHPTRNGDRRPDTIVATSSRKVTWRCPKGPDHVWDAPVYRRAVAGVGCPYCANMRVSVTNSVQAVAPWLAAEWHPTRNQGLTSRDLVSQSTRPVVWRCLRRSGHEWTRSPYHRMQQLSSCPKCNPGQQSKQEIRLAFELAQLLRFNPRERWVPAGGKRQEVDILIRRLRLVVEFDGARYHDNDRSRERDARKTALLQAAGWRVIRVRPAPLAAVGPHDVLVSREERIKDWADAVLLKIRSAFGVEIPGLEGYLALEKPQNQAAADAAIEARLRRLAELADALAEKKRARAPSGANVRRADEVGLRPPERAIALQ